MKKKIFITGGGGMLASEIEKYYLNNNSEVLAPTHQELDVLDIDKLSQEVFSYKPYYVFHTATLHVNDCEKNPELAFKVNSWASENLARICSKINAVLIYIGSCGYFGDGIKYYSENDPVVLKTIYAKSKFQGEATSLKECKKTFAIRPGWLFGGSIKHKKNFVFQRYQEAKNYSVLKSTNDKYGSPTYAGDLVKKIDEILTNGNPGVYHVSNNGGCSRYEYVKKIVESCNLKTNIIPVDSSNFPRKANVPACELLDNHNLRQLGLHTLPPWEDAIERYVLQMLKEI